MPPVSIISIVQGPWERQRAAGLDDGQPASRPRVGTTATLWSTGFLPRPEHRGGLGGAGAAGRQGEHGGSASRLPHLSVLDGRGWVEKARYLVTVRRTMLRCVTGIQSQ